MGLVTQPFHPYTGPHQISTSTLEIPTSPSFDFSTARLKSTKHLALIHETTLVTIFYPTSSQPSNQDRGMEWIERPLSTTARGYSKFLGKPYLLVKSLLWLFARNVYLPAMQDQPLLPPQADEKSEGNRFDVIVFSHGLSGNRTTYSQYCGELASRGYIVCAVEHRDGSGPISIINSRRNGVVSSREVDYIKEDDIYYPSNDSNPPFLDFRASQLLMRQSEIEHVVSILSRLDDGEGDVVARENLRRETKNRGDDEKEEETIWRDWKGRLNLNRVGLTMSGHSFGGATTIQILRSQATSSSSSSDVTSKKSSPRFGKGIALDPWADPIPPAEQPTSSSSSTSTSTLLGDNEEGNKNEGEPLPDLKPSSDSNSSSENASKTAIKVPLLVINSEAFTLWRPHFYRVRDIVERSVVEGERRWFFTLLGSIHLSFSDIALLFPRFFKKKTTSPPYSILQRFLDPSIEFLSLPSSSSSSPDTSTTNYLKEKVIEGDREPTNFELRGEGEKGPLKRIEEEERNDQGWVRAHVSSESS